MSPRQSFEHALLLIARRHGGGTATALAAEDELARWRAQSAEHDTIYRLALEAWQASHPAGLESHLTRPQPSAARRRKVVAALATLGLTALTGAMARWWWLQPVELATLDTGRAQTLLQRMGDGSELQLAARTSAGVAYYRNRREVLLTSGELRLQVSRDSARPFTVRTRWGRVEVLGTVFTVAVRGETMAVEVAEGRVAVWRNPDAGGATPDVELHPGDAVRVSSPGPAEPYKVAIAGVGAWKDGWMVFDGTPLPEAILRWNDYLAWPLLMGGDQALARLRLTGSFRLGQPEAFLQALPKILPVRLVRQADGSGLIVPR